MYYHRRCRMLRWTWAALVRQGHDTQIEKAEEVILEQLKKNPLPDDKKPEYPNYHQVSDAGSANRFPSTKPTFLANFFDELKRQLPASKVFERIKSPAGRSFEWYDCILT
jgi:hypothetical protein